MIDARSMETESSTDLLHVALVGPESNGKSTLGSTAPGVKLFMDYDQKKQVLAGKKDVYCITFKNPGESYKLQEAAEEVLDVMSGLEQSLDLANLKDKRGIRLFPEVKEGTFVKSLFHDSMSSLGKVIMDYELSSSGDLKREIKIGPKLSINIPKNFDAWNAEMKGVESIIMRSFSLPLNVFCIFHERAEEAPDSSIERPKYTGRVSLYPVRYKDLLLKYFTDIWRVKLTNIQGVYVPRVYVLPDFAHDNASSMKLDAVEEPDISKMIAKHKSRTPVVIPTAPTSTVSAPKGPIVTTIVSQPKQVAGIVKS